MLMSCLTCFFVLGRLDFPCFHVIMMKSTIECCVANNALSQTHFKVKWHIAGCIYRVHYQVYTYTLVMFIRPYLFLCYYAQSLLCAFFKRILVLLKNAYMYSIIYTIYIFYIFRSLTFCKL